MRMQKMWIVLIIAGLVLFEACNFLGQVFKAGMGVGIAIVVAVIIIIFLISRSGKRRV